MMANIKCDDRPQKGGWAPGNYLDKCTTCTEQFIGGKHAIICADCAYKTVEPAVEKPYRVLLRQDAWINHEAIVWASSKEEAADMVVSAWKEGDRSIKIRETDQSCFDYAEADPEEVEEITTEQLAAENPAHLPSDKS